MRLTWRWFGPIDHTAIDDILQAGAEGVVSALHHIPPGVVWTREEIAKRQQQVGRRRDGAPSEIAWEVVESLPVSEDIKRQTGAWREHIANYQQSLENLAAQGIQVVCYNFMPILDWTRTDLRWRLAHGGTTMRFDLIDFAGFDLYLLERKGAEQDYTDDVISQAGQRIRELSSQGRQRLIDNIACGLPGDKNRLTLEGIRHALARYADFDADRLRRHCVAFLEAVAPLAQRLGLRLCCHPDDPPFPLLGLPRIMSTEADFSAILAAVDLPANGIALCAGSLGARPDNDLPGMIERLGDRIHFLHLRNLKREGAGYPVSFHEVEHLAGDTDMVALIAAVLKQEHQRRRQGRSDWSIPVRPDHGVDILDDLNHAAQPGYPSIGRLKGLAELRGVMAALSHPSFWLQP